jgi:hypothetical protein
MNDFLSMYQQFVQGSYGERQGFNGEQSQQMYSGGDRASSDRSQASTDLVSPNQPFFCITAHTCSYTHEKYPLFLTDVQFFALLTTIM